MAQPNWFAQLKWSNPVTVASLNQDRTVIPDFPGCYAFTDNVGALLPRQVLYIGEAKTSLRQRLPVYLIDWTRKLPPGSKGHKGKGFLLMERQNRGDHGLYVRWVQYGGGAADISLLESSLIEYLLPHYNDRDESVRHGIMGDWERLDSRLLL